MRFTSRARLVLTFCADSLACRCASSKFASRSSPLIVLPVAILSTLLLIALSTLAFSPALIALVTASSATPVRLNARITSGASVTPVPSARFKAACDPMFLPKSLRLSLSAAAWNTSEASPVVALIAASSPRRFIRLYAFLRAVFSIIFCVTFSAPNLLTSCFSAALRMSLEEASLPMDFVSAFLRTDFGRTFFTRALPACFERFDVRPNVAIEAAISPANSSPLSSLPCLLVRYSSISFVPSLACFIKSFDPPRVAPERAPRVNDAKCGCFSVSHFASATSSAKAPPLITCPAFGLTSGL